MSKKLLVVEDDANIARLVKYNLDKAGFACTVLDNGADVLPRMNAERFDLVILDLMLPEIDGLELCRTIKQDTNLSSTPIIIVTAKGEEIDRVVGFELGADDYVVKPFSPRELVLRVKAVLKRGVAGKAAEGKTGDILRAGNIEIDCARHKTTVNGNSIDLTLTEFKLLLTLLSRKGRVQSRDKLLSDVWDIEADITTRTIDTHVKRLRQKLGDEGEHIQTVRGIGYRFEEID